MVEEQARELEQCLALYAYPGSEAEPVWIHVRFESADGEGPMWDGDDVVFGGHDDRWMDESCGEEVDTDRVLEWAPLPSGEYSLATSLIDLRQQIFDGHRRHTQIRRSLQFLLDLRIYPLGRRDTEKQMLVSLAQACALAGEYSEAHLPPEMLTPEMRERVWSSLKLEPRRAPDEDNCPPTERNDWRDHG